MAENDVLQQNVWLGDVLYRRGTTPPADVAKKITNPNVWGGPIAVVAPTAGALTLSTPTTTVVQDPEDDASETPVYPQGLPDDSWTVKDLRAWAKDNDLTLGEAKAKPQILEAIAAHLGGAADEIEQTDPADPAE